MFRRCQAFGMVLDRLEPRQEALPFGSQFRGFDHAVRCRRGSPQRRRQPVDRLVMRAVHPERGRPGDRREPAIRGQIDPVRDIVAEVHLVVRRHAGDLGGQIDIKRAAEEDVHQLMAAADGEQRLPLAEDLGEQRQFHHVARRFGQVAGREQRFRHLRPVPPRIDIVATAEQDAARLRDGIRQHLPIGRQRQRRGQSAGCEHRVEITARHAGRMVGHLGPGGRRARRDEDQRSHRKTFQPRPAGPLFNPRRCAQGSGRG